MIDRITQRGFQTTALASARTAGTGDHESQMPKGQAVPIVVIGHGRYCQINTAAMVLGTTRKAIEHKIARGIWVRGKHVRKAPDGILYVNMAAIYAWIEGEV
jgi:hypothetical protein